LYIYVKKTYIFFLVTCFWNGNTCEDVRNIDTCEDFLSEDPCEKSPEGVNLVCDWVYNECGQSSPSLCATRGTVSSCCKYTVGECEIRTISDGGGGTKGCIWRTEGSSSSCVDYACSDYGTDGVKCSDNGKNVSGECAINGVPGSCVNKNDIDQCFEILDRINCKKSSQFPELEGVCEWVKMEGVESCVKKEDVKSCTVYSKIDDCNDGFFSDTDEYRGCFWGSDDVCKPFVCNDYVTQENCNNNAENVESECLWVGSVSGGGCVNIADASCESYLRVEYCGNGKISETSGKKICFWNGDDKGCMLNSSVEGCEDILIEDSCSYEPRNGDNWYSDRFKFVESSLEPSVKCVWVKKKDYPSAGECKGNKEIEDCGLYLQNDCNSELFLDVDNNNTYRGCTWNADGDSCVKYDCNNYESDVSCVSNAKMVVGECFIERGEVPICGRIDLIRTCGDLLYRDNCISTQDETHEFDKLQHSRCEWVKDEINNDEECIDGTAGEGCNIFTNLTDCDTHYFYASKLNDFSSL
jgi:hypothetical protein